jgi:hypothetical protein
MQHRLRKDTVIYDTENLSDASVLIPSLFEEKYIKLWPNADCKLSVICENHCVICQNHSLCDI